MGEQEGGHWQGDTAAFIDPLDQLAAMSPPPETTITRPPIREVIDQAVTIISSYPWAKEYAAQVEARITAALGQCIQFRARTNLESGDSGDLLQQQISKGAYESILGQPARYIEHAGIIESALEAMRDIVHEHLRKDIAELNRQIESTIAEIASELGRNGRITATLLCEKLNAYFPPPQDFYALKPKSFCLEVSYRGELEHIYGQARELYHDPEGQEKAANKELTVQELYATTEVLKDLISSPIKSSWSEQEHLAQKAIYAQIVWERKQGTS